MMQNIQTKQEEERWSLHQYSFIECSRKTGPLDCRFEYWIQSQSSHWIPPVAKATVRIFSSRTDLPQSLSFHTVCWVPKTVFLTCFNFTARPHCCHCVVNGGFEVNQKCWTNSHTTFCSLWYCMSEHRMTFDVYWPVRKMQVAHSERYWVHEL